MTPLSEQQRALLQAVRRLAIRGEPATPAALKAETGWLTFQILDAVDQLAKRGILKRIGPAWTGGNRGREVVIANGDHPQLMEEAS